MLSLGASLTRAGGPCSTSAAARAFSATVADKVQSLPGRWWEGVESAEQIAETLLGAQAGKVATRGVSVSDMFAKASSVEELALAVRASASVAQVHAGLHGKTDVYSTQVVNALVEACLRIDAPEVAVNVLQQWRHLGLPVSGVLLGNLFSFLASKDDTHLIARAYSAIKANNIEPLPRIAHPIVSMFVRLGDTKTAIDIVAEFEANGMELPSRTKHVIEDGAATVEVEAEGEAEEK